jgi:hypothetical protein
METKLVGDNTTEAQYKARNPRDLRAFFIRFSSLQCVHLFKVLSPSKYEEEKAVGDDTNSEKDIPGCYSMPSVN